MTTTASVKHVIFLCVFSLMTFSSCDQFVSIEPPENRLEEGLVFSNEAAALSAVYGVYANMVASNLLICNGASTLYPALSADELIYTGADPELLSFFSNSVIADNGTGIYSRLWVAAYRNIYFANAVIEGLEKAVNIPVTTSWLLKGEMLVIRSLNFFLLANLFGDIPLVISTDYRINGTMSRTPIDEVYVRIIEDLKKAKTLLENNDVAAESRFRVNEFAASTLLARVYLYVGEWQLAEAESTYVISSGQFHLEQDINKIFQPSSMETIWLLSNDYRNTAEGITFIPASPTNPPTYALTDYLLGAFETGDLRKDNWLGINTIEDNMYYYPYKYKERSSTAVIEYNIVFRMAELYLIRAESKAHGNDIEGALADLNQIRRRATLGEVKDLTQSETLDAIYKERQVEFFCEWGHRWFDLKRTGRATAVLAERKQPNWDETDVRYPIPAGELLTNTFLKQNPGY